MNSWIEYSPKGHNCNLCKHTKTFSKIGNVCIGEKFRGKIIKEDDKICDEYEFGGFVELAKGILNIPRTDKM